MKTLHQAIVIFCMIPIGAAIAPAVLALIKIEMKK